MKDFPFYDKGGRAWKLNATRSRLESHHHQAGRESWRPRVDNNLTSTSKATHESVIRKRACDMIMHTVLQVWCRNPKRIQVGIGEWWRWYRQCASLHNAVFRVPPPFLKHCFQEKQLPVCFAKAENKGCENGSSISTANFMDLVAKGMWDDGAIYVHSMKQSLSLSAHAGHRSHNTSSASASSSFVSSSSSCCCCELNMITQCGKGGSALSCSIANGLQLCQPLPLEDQINSKQTSKFKKNRALLVWWACPPHQLISRRMANAQVSTHCHVFFVFLGFRV